MAKNRPSKDRRQARNRARREALAARRAAARERDGGGSESSDTSASSAGGQRKGLVGRLLGGGSGGGTKRTPAERPAPIRGRPEGPMPRDDKGRVPGQRAALFAFFFAVASVATLLIVPISIEREIDSPADAPDGCEIVEPDEDAEDPQLTCEDSVTVVGELGAVGVGALMVPLAITGVGFWATTREKQARIWTFCLLAFAAFLLVFAIGGLLFLPSMIALTVASFQGRRAEQQLLQAQHAAKPRTRADEPGDEDETVADDPSPDDDG